MIGQVIVDTVTGLLFLLLACVIFIVPTVIGGYLFGRPGMVVGAVVPMVLVVSWVLGTVMRSDDDDDC